MESRTTSCSNSGQRAAGSGQENEIRPAPAASPLPTAHCPLPTPAGPPSAVRRPPSAEEGFTLAALLVILTVISVVIAMTVPEQWSMVMQRERDKQTIFQMKQVARAIRIWQRKHSALPTSLEQLKEAKQPRVLRFGGEEFVMPLTGKEDDWILVPMQAVEAGTPVPGVTPGGGPGRPGPGTGTPTPAPAPTPGAPPGQPGLTGPSKLRKDASPKDYVGPFVGIRPNLSGKSFLALNGAEDYSEWVYTVQDLENEINMRIAAINLK